MTNVLAHERALTGDRVGPTLVAVEGVADRWPQALPLAPASDARAA